MRTIRVRMDQLPRVLQMEVQRTEKTQRQFARELGFTEKHISFVFNGKANITLNFLHAVMKNLNLTITLIP